SIPLPSARAPPRARRAAARRPASAVALPAARLRREVVGELMQPDDVALQPRRRIAEVAEAEAGPAVEGVHQIAAGDPAVDESGAYEIAEGRERGVPAGERVPRLVRRVGEIPEDGRDERVRQGASLRAVGGAERDARIEGLQVPT